MDHGIPYRRPRFVSIIYVASACDTVRVIDEHRAREMRIMNIQTVPSTLDNYPAMSLLGTFHCPELSLLIAVELNIDELIDEQ